MLDNTPITGHRHGAVRLELNQQEVIVYNFLKPLGSSQKACFLLGCLASRGALSNAKLDDLKIDLVLPVTA